MKLPLSVPSLAVTPDDHQFSEATRLLTRGDLAQAQAIFEDVLRRHPNHFDCVRRLAMIALETGRYADAVSLCCQALEINPSSAETYIDSYKFFCNTYKSCFSCSPGNISLKCFLCVIIC